jgi:hypothetical protein
LAEALPPSDRLARAWERKGDHILSPGRRLAWRTPVLQQAFVELPFVDVEVAHFRMLGLPGRDWIEGGAAEERHLHVCGEDVEAEEPAFLPRGAAKKGEFDFTAFRTAGTVRAINEPIRRPTSLFQPGIGAI